MLAVLSRAPGLRFDRSFCSEWRIIKYIRHFFLFFIFCWYILSYMNQRIAYQFIEKLKQKYPKDNLQILGILGFGSYFNKNKFSKNSDLDIYIVIKNNGNRYRGIMHVEGVEVDYFVNPIERLKSDWKKVKYREVSRKTIAYMLRDGIVILDRNGMLKKLQKEAKLFLKDELKNSGLNHIELTTAKYFIQDYVRDIEDSLLNKDIFSWQYNIHSLLNYLIEIFCRYHKISIIKQKYQAMEIAKKDKRFVKLYQSIAESNSKKEVMKRIDTLVGYCLKSMGGALAQEWDLKSSSGV